MLRIREDNRDRPLKMLQNRKKNQKKKEKQSKERENSNFILRIRRIIRIGHGRYFKTGVLTVAQKKK
jgi:hypothetical protein